MMDRRFLVLSSSSSVKRAGERIVIRSASKSYGVPIRYLDVVVVIGKVNFSGEALHLLLVNNVPVFFCSLGGRIRASLVSHEYMSKHNNRLIQYEAYKTRRLEVARFVVLSKLRSIAKEFGIDTGDLCAQIDSSQSVEHLMGIEGRASREMFRALSQSIEGKGLDFRSREYRPPPDPVNALLSLAYTFGYMLAFPLVNFFGYDPYISFLHSKRGSHASFCSDVLEFARAYITKEVGRAIVLGVFSQEDFNRSRKGVFLKRDKLGKFVSWFESIKDRAVSLLKEGVLSVGEVMKDEVRCVL